jgi:outer membrane receptor protein involved in Fe transport
MVPGFPSIFYDPIMTWAKWHHIPALRYDWHSTFKGVLDPRFTAVYHATDWWAVSANVAKSFRAPSFLELFFQSASFNGNRDLNPEIAWSYDVGNKFRSQKYFLA